MLARCIETPFRMLLAPTAILAATLSCPLRSINLARKQMYRRQLSGSRRPFSLSSLVRKVKSARAAVSAEVAPQPPVMPLRVLKAVTFDFTGTLAQVRGKTEDHYMRVLHDVISSEPTLGPKVWDDIEEAIKPNVFPAFVNAYRRHMRELPNFGYGNVSSEQWWEKVIDQTFNEAGVSKEVLDIVLQRVGHDLYELFKTQSAWELYPEVPDLIRNLSESGVTLGVVSNFDERLSIILESLGISSYFDFVVTSHDFGIEKPSPEIFAEAMALANVSDPSHILHVGDTVYTDVAGPVGFGMPFLYVEREDMSTQKAKDNRQAVADLLSRVEDKTTVSSMVDGVVLTNLSRVADVVSQSSG
ncbi:hypothetical protein AAMO2058_000118000 [Amorphochlora amoebiformis]